MRWIDKTNLVLANALLASASSNPAAGVPASTGISSDVGAAVQVRMSASVVNLPSRTRARITAASNCCA
jgi:hypothetical protein